MERPIISGLEGIGLSPNLWRNFAVDNILANRDLGMGIGMFDDFLGFGQTYALASSLGRYSSRGITYRSYELVGGTSGAGISAKTAVATRPGGIVLTTSTTDNDNVSLQAGSISPTANIVPFAVIPGTSADLAFECEFKVSTVTADQGNFFIGLAGTGGAVTVLPLTASDIIGSIDALGFTKLRAATTALSMGYNRISGTPGTKASIATMAADTFIKAGFVYDGLRGTVMPYINGVAQTAKVITAAATGATPWPTAYMTLCAAVMNYTTTAVSMTINWWAVAQKFNSLTTVTP